MKAAPKKTVRAWLGGSFDPPHLGHLAMAKAVFLRLQRAKIPSRVALLPSKSPAKRIRHAKDADRLAMLCKSVEEYNAFWRLDLGVDTREMRAKSDLSYTRDTLAALRRAYPADALIFVVGEDSLNALPTWKGGIDLLDLAHFWVFGRKNGKTNAAPSWDCRPFLADLPTLMRRPSGSIFWDDTPIAAVSSSAIRRTLAQGGHSPFLTPKVAAYIRDRGLYRQSAK